MVFLSLIGLVGVISLLVFLEGVEDRELEDLEFKSSEENINTTEGGTKFLVHPDRLIQGCPSMDCIPSIDSPSFVSVDETEWLQEDEKVIGVEEGGEAKAYPLRILSSHEIVNDRIDGEPIAVTYCPLCRSGVTYSREIGNKTLEFGVSGKLLNANLVMYDRGTESYWNQIEGKAIIGPRTGQNLDLKFSSITTWKDWKEGHPETDVLSRNTGIYPPSSYDGSQYERYRASDSVGFGVEDVDDTLPSKEVVHGIKAGGEAKAYREKDLEDNLIQDSIGGEAVVIFENSEDGSITSFIRSVDGEKFDVSIVDDALRDSEGREWTFNGEEVNGERKLETLNPKSFYWFAWKKFNPDTKVYNDTNQE